MTQKKTKQHSTKVKKYLTREAPSVASRLFKNSMIGAAASLIYGIQILSFAQTQNRPLNTNEFNQKATHLLDQVLGETEPRIVQDYAIGGNILGKIWLTEEPSLLQPNLNISAPTVVAIKDGLINEAVQFNIFCNYFAFIDKAEIYIFAPLDTERLQPLHTIPVNLDKNKNQVSLKWDALTPSSIQLKEGQTIQYVLRVFNTHGQWDETAAGQINLVSGLKRAQYLENIKTNTNLSTQLRSLEAGLSLEEFQIGRSILGSNNLAIQNIILQGSRVRVRGHAIPEGVQLKINGQNILIDNERKFVSEYLLPLGQYDFKLEGTDSNGTKLDSLLQAQIRGSYWLFIGLADLTASENTYAGKIEAVRPEDLENFNKDHIEGRLAFYLKGKIKGKYLITAQLDTEEKDLKDLLKNILKADRAELLRKIDPEAYYPIYGDDSVSKRDVDTSGRLFVRLDWDKNIATWGNVQTDLTGTQLANYNRSLYGAKLLLKSINNTNLGQANHTLKVFAAEQQTAPAKVEFLGTGGSLYYLRNTDLVPNSESISLEIRDPYSGRVVNNYLLKANRDYEINYYQGRVVLTRPLVQITKDNSPIQEGPSEGLQNYLVVNYEYYPIALDQSNYSTGVNVKHWINDQLALGATAVKEQRAGQDYELLAADLTLQRGAGTWVKIEHAQSQSFLSPIYFSNDGGLSYEQYGSAFINNTTTIGGNVSAVELRLNSKEQNWTENQWKLAAWYRKQDAGFSAGHTNQIGNNTEQSGIELIGQLNTDLQLLVGYKKVASVSPLAPLTQENSNTAALEKNTTNHNINQQHRLQLGLLWQPSQDFYLNFELQQLVQSQNTIKSETGLAGIKVNQKINDNWDVYVSSQTSFEKVNYQNNQSISVGTQYTFDNFSKASIDLVNGDKGNAITISADYKRTAEHSLYGSYSYAPSWQANNATPLLNESNSASTSIADAAFASATKATVGQRYQLSPEVKLTQETQQLSDLSSNGLLNSMGIDFLNNIGFSLATSAQKGILKNVQTGINTNRKSYSIAGGFNNTNLEWSSKIEYRIDQKEPSENNLDISVPFSGLEKQQQWISTNRLKVNIANNWRMLAKANYALTQSQSPSVFNNLNSTDASSNKDNNNNFLFGKSQTDAQLFDSSIGFAWRPTIGRLNALFKHQYLYDLAPTGQISNTGSQFDQKSHITSLEGTYTVNPYLELGAKVAKRLSSMRLERGQGEWLKNNATYSALQARVYVGDKGVEADGSAKNIWSGWSVMTEYRQLKVENGGTKQGALITLDKDLGKNLRFGLGYNFTDFSSDLSQLSYKHKGAFVNLVMTLGISR